MNLKHMQFLVNENSVSHLFKMFKNKLFELDKGKRKYLKYEFHFSFMVSINDTLANSINSSIILLIVAVVTFSLLRICRETYRCT